MADFQGKFQYLAPGGGVTQVGSCRVQFDAQTLTLTPTSGAVLAFDLGDLDAVTAADWELRLSLFTGRTILLRQFGKAYDNLAHDLTDAYRNRAVQCLLLEDMGELARFTGNFELTAGNATPRSGAAEIRLYKSNLAVLPATSQSFQWRLADVDDLQFDAIAYEVALRAGEERLKFGRLAKRTEEFSTKLREAVDALASQTAQALHGMLPFLDPDQLESCGALLREGRSAPLAKLSAIHRQIPAALAANAVDNDLKPYYDQLVSRTACGTSYAGFRLVQPEDGTGAGADAPSADDAALDEDGDINAPDTDASAPQTLYWFFFPMAATTGGAVLANAVAWEASSRSGRATYFFRLVNPAQAAHLADSARAPAILETSIRRLNRVLALLNFRRSPIYLSDDELAMNPRFHRYAIAARRMPEVREVRASFLGRAMHSSPEAWQTQVASILGKAGNW
jgi:hypothetical protein